MLPTGVIYIEEPITLTSARRYASKWLYFTLSIYLPSRITVDGYPFRRALNEQPGLTNRDNSGRYHYTQTAAGPRMVCL